jgi:hypothetical protein
MLAFARGIDSTFNCQSFSAGECQRQSLLVGLRDNGFMDALSKEKDESIGIFLKSIASAGKDGSMGILLKSIVSAGKDGSMGILLKSIVSTGKDGRDAFGEAFSTGIFNRHLMTMCVSLYVGGLARQNK